MSDFKVNGSTPEEGKLKLGSSDIKRIYKGNHWVWPKRDTSYTPTTLNFPQNNFYFIADVPQTGVYRSSASTTNTDDNGFAIFDIFFNKQTPAVPFGPMPKYRQEWYNPDPAVQSNPNALIDLGYSLKYSSDDYKYLLAYGSAKHGGGVHWATRLANGYRGFDYTKYGLDSLIFSNDYGQTWSNLFEGNTATVEEGYRFDGIFSTTMSDNGKVIIIQYIISPVDIENSIIITTGVFGDITARINSKIKYIISRDYGASFSEMTEFENYYNTQRENFITDGTSQFSGLGDNYDFNYKANYNTYSYNPDFTYVNIVNMQVSEISISSSGKYIFMRDAHMDESQSIHTDRVFLSTDFGYSFDYLTNKIKSQLNTSFNDFFAGDRASTLPKNSDGSDYDLYFRRAFSIHDAAVSGDGRSYILSLNPVLRRLSTSAVDSFHVVSTDYGETWAKLDLYKSVTQNLDYDDRFKENSVTLDYSGNNLLVYPSNELNTNNTRGSLYGQGWHIQNNHLFHVGNTFEGKVQSKYIQHEGSNYTGTVTFQALSSDGQYVTMAHQTTNLTSLPSNNTLPFFSNFFLPKPILTDSSSSLEGRWLGKSRSYYQPGSDYDYVHPIKILNL